MIQPGKQYIPKGKGKHTRLAINKGYAANRYVTLMYDRDSRYLGKYEPATPTALLDIVLSSISKLTLVELRAVLNADKSMRG